MLSSTHMLDFFNGDYQRQINRGYPHGHGDDGDDDHDDDEEEEDDYDDDNWINNPHDVSLQLWIRTWLRPT